jgi:hypothetical protein
MTPTLYSKKFVKYTLLRKYLKQRLSASVHFTLTFKVFRCDSTYGRQVFRKEGLKITDHPSGEGQASGIKEGKSLCIPLCEREGINLKRGVHCGSMPYAFAFGKVLPPAGYRSISSEGLKAK